MGPSHVLEHAERWLSRRWVPAVVNLAALALLSYSLAQTTWRLLTPPTVDNPGTAARANDNGGDYDLRPLVAANLFGQADAAAKTDVTLDAIPLSSLNLALTGVMVTPAGSFALISADGSPELPFGIGDEISAGVALHAVYADRVLIRRGGATESLMLRDTAQALPTGAIVGSRTPTPRPDPSRVVQRSGDHSFTVDRQQLNQQMQTPEFLTQALMVPNAGGGFLVREIQPGSIYEKLGLRVGDVIGAVNGQPVNSVEDVMRLYGQFSSAATVQIDVRRAGRSETLVYNIR